MTPYAWVLFITGDQTAGGNTVSIDTDIFEIIDVADEFYGFMSYQELRKGKIGLFADVLWGRMNFGLGGVKELGPIPGVPGINANLSIEADADIWVDMAIVEPGVAFEIINRSSGGSFKDPVPSMRSTAIDVVAGARY